MLDPSKVCLFIPKELAKFKLNLFNRIGAHIEKQGGTMIRGNHEALDDLPLDVLPIVGGAPYLLPLVRKWKASGRQWIGWDRGYVRRVFATWLPRGHDGGYYRWTLNRYQMGSIRDVPDDRWQRLVPGNQTDARAVKVEPWRRGGRHIVVALPSRTYARSHDGADTWADDTIRKLSLLTSRQLVIRDKETKRPLQDDLRDAHCLVTHGSNAAVEAVISGCPVIVHPDSAAALVGLTDLSKVESPIYPERQPWLNSLAYSQYNEAELCDGTLWRLIQ